MFLSKEIHNQHEKSKTQMMVSLGEQRESNTEKIWAESGYFNDQRVDLTIPNANFPENTLVYVNQGSISPVKDGEAIYLEYVVLGQIMPVANPDPSIDLDTYKFKENECLLYVPLYNKENGLYRGLSKKLGYITLRGDKNETFYSYGYDKERSRLLYCSMKQPIPNIYFCTNFKKHRNYLLNEKATERLASTLFLFLPSTLDRKEEMLQFRNSVNLHPIEATYADNKEFNDDKDFSPIVLETKDINSVTPLFYAYMKKIAETSNNNLIRNSNAFLETGGRLTQIQNLNGSILLMKKPKKNFRCLINF